MKNLIRMAVPAVAVILMSGIPVAAQSAAQNTPTTQTSSQTQDWNTPPAGTEQAQQGFRDGIQAAQLDRAAKRPIDAKVSHLYIHPPVKGAVKDQYRTSFEAGYNAAVKHGASSM